MSFLKRLFAGSDHEKENNDGDFFWKSMTKTEDITEALENSYQQKVVVFKHSTRCFISKTVLRHFEKECKEATPPYQFYFLDLIAHRDLSNQIAQDWAVVHQSPQIIVLENGQVTHNASHNNISLSAI